PAQNSPTTRRCRRRISGSNTALASRQQIQAYLGFLRPELACPRVPKARLGNVGRHALCSQGGQHDRVIGGAKRDRGARVIRLRCSPQQNSRRSDVAFGNEILATFNEKLDLLTIEANLRLCNLGSPRGGLAQGQTRLEQVVGWLCQRRAGLLFLRAK